MGNRKRAAGYSFLDILTIIVVTGAMLGIGLYVYLLAKDVRETSQMPQRPSYADEALSMGTAKTGLKEYKNKAYAMSFKYPSDWKLSEKVTDMGGGKTQSEVDVTSPNGTVVGFYLNLGGKGGACVDPEAGDQPTARACHTFETLKLEPFESGIVGRTLYLYQAKATPPTSRGGEAAYVIGVKDNKNGTPVIGTALVDNTTSVITVGASSYINITVSGKEDAKKSTATFLETNQVKEATSVLKTLRLTAQ